MEIDGGNFNWRNHYGGESSDDRRLKVVGRNEEMIDTETVTTTWPSVVWAVESQEPLSLFVISLEDGTEYLVSAHDFDEAWHIVTARVAIQAIRETRARAVEMPRLPPENTLWIPLPTQPQLLHVFKSKAEE